LAVPVSCVVPNEVQVIQQPGLLLGEAEPGEVRRFESHDATLTAPVGVGVDVARGVGVEQKPRTGRFMSL